VTVECLGHSSGTCRKQCAVEWVGLLGRMLGIKTCRSGDSQKKRKCKDLNKCQRLRYWRSWHNRFLVIGKGDGEKKVETGESYFR